MKVFAGILFLLLALLPTANAQTVTGSVTGTVVDSAGAVVVGAQVELINNVSKQAREFKTSSTGSFEFSGILPGGYSLKITQPGFKTHEQQNVTVSAQVRVDVHTIR